MKIGINTLELSKEINNLLTLKEEYETTYRNIFNVLSSSSFFWNDPLAQSFYQDLEQEKIKNEKEIMNITNKIEIYKYIYDKYTMLGNKINCNLESKDNILVKIDNILNEIQTIIKKYNSLNTSFCEEEEYYLINEKTKLESISKKIEEIKETINNSYTKILEIEREVSNRLSKLENIEIEEFNESNYMKE